MISDDLDNCQIGEVGERFVAYKLRKWGEEVVDVGQSNPYDLVVLRDNPIRLQVKTTLKLNGQSYQFNIGTGSKKKKYKEGAYDALCLVALDIERVYFDLFSDQKMKRVHPNKYTKENQYLSWKAVLDNLTKT